MSLTTCFQFVKTSYLPLPPLRPPSSQMVDGPSRKPETLERIQERGKNTAIKMLHQPELIIMLNPLVQHYSRISLSDPAQSDHLVDLDRLAPAFNVHLSDPPSCSDFKDSRAGEFVHYEIIDKFILLGGLTSKLMTYRACFRPLYPDTPSGQWSDKESIGLETISDPGSGVALLGKWMLTEDVKKPGFLVLTETVSVQCNVFLGWYVRSQLETAHTSLHKEFGRRFCERMMEEDPLKGQSGKEGKSWAETKTSLQRTGTGSTGASFDRVQTG